MASPELEALQKGERVRVQGGKNFEKFHGGMEATILENRPDSRNMLIQFDDVSTSGPEPLSVAYRHLEPAPQRGGYRAGPAPAAAGHAGAEAPKEQPKGPLADEHGSYRTRQLVQLYGLQSAQELNGKLGRLRKFDVNAERWEVDVRECGIKRLKEDNLGPPPKPEVPAGLSVEELKAQGNEHFKRVELEQAIAFYGAALDLLDDEEADAEKRPKEAEDAKYVSVLYGNRAQCYINLCREVHGEERHISKEARNYAMRANMDAARAIELDPTNGKALYRRGCAVLGMAPSASRAKEAISYLELALTGRASGGKDGIVLPNQMRNEVTNLLEYAKRRLDQCVEAAVPDVEQCRENCRQQ
eukprot:TRINITY_DN63054_c0_g1_i1.p1 TRINITY_DN63054_c0_g1~~TRINITY_DN63054_c0_g1_i1.p1  ORF type:complete len:408 (+),score=90.22 TRINITY_DN63054_c0_g1_i1:152-1225(+)